MRIKSLWDHGDTKTDDELLAEAMEDLKIAENEISTEGLSTKTKLRGATFIKLVVTGYVDNLENVKHDKHKYRDVIYQLYYTLGFNAESPYDLIKVLIKAIRKSISK